MMARRIGFLAVLWVLGVGSCALAADSPAAKADPQALMQQAQEAYKQGQVQQAIDALQKAIALLQESQRQGLAAFFPKVPDGWEADKVQSNSFSAGGNQEQNSFSYTTLTRTYKHKGDDLSVEITLANSPQMINTYKGMMDTFKNPQTLAMMNQNPDTKLALIDQEGWNGWSTLNKGSDAQFVALNGAYLLTLKVSKDDQTTLDSFWKAIDLKGLNAQGSPPSAEK
jgi:flagellin-specific chaperone FliS